MDEGGSIGSAAAGCARSGMAGSVRHQAGTGELEAAATEDKGERLKCRDSADSAPCGLVHPSSS